MHSHYPSSFKAWLQLSILTGLLLLLAACGGVSTAEKTLLAQQKYEDAQSPGQSRKEQYNKIKEAIRISPKEPLYRVGLGDLYFKDEKLGMAEKMYLSAIKVDPDYRIAYRMLGRLYMQKSQWNDATIYLTRALNQPNVINPIQLYNWLGYSEYRKGDLPKAERAWLRALDINDNEKIRLNLALIYKEGNRLDLAQASLIKALEMNPKLPSAHFALAEIYYKRNKFGKARKHFNEVIQLEPLSQQAKNSQQILNKLSVRK
jgi:Tfp pilus assembly protein PilF